MKNTYSSKNRSLYEDYKPIYIQASGLCFAKQGTSSQVNILENLRYVIFLHATNTPSFF